MQTILRQILNILFHQIRHCFHLVFVISVFLHKTLRLKNFNIKQLMLRRIFLERLRNPLVTITNKNYDHVFLPHFDVIIHIHRIIVLEYAFHGCFEFALVLIKHSDTYCQFWVLVAHHVQFLHSA
jgi:hypothetical protein